jgi:hypothetical protein
VVKVRVRREMGRARHTTFKLSLAPRVLAVKDRHCAREAIRVERVACRKAREGSLDAIVWVGVAQWEGEVVVLLMSFCRFHDSAFQSGCCHWLKLILSWHRSC